MVEKRTLDNALPKLIKDSIMEDILKGKLEAGDKLVESEYSQLFGTSRAPVREAFYLLTLEGIAKKIPRKGTVVRGFSREEMSDILKIRNFLEQLAIDKLTVNMREKCVQEMSKIISEMENNEQDVREYAKLNFEFHFQLIVASESEILRNIYSNLGYSLISLQTFSLMGKEKVVKKSLEEHKEFVKFLSSGEIEKAKLLLNSHNDAVFPRVEESLKE
ncbi:GntR family transcriptional regulator [Brevibacillus sp. NRS-1366]|uniref:GntR family transcriptional regulator n=1 Tax=Brevibacillus sp. NRS-1366 TaxID=3233899 RepID=UPI003D1CFF5B